MKKIATLAIALALLMSCFCLPVMAAHSHTITIENTVPGHIFEAYQIFSGNVVTVDGENVLTDVLWGSGVNTSATVEWDIGGTPTDLTLLQALQNATVNPGYYNLYLTATDAEDVVEVLSTNNTSAHAMEFATIVGKYLSANCATSAPTMSGSDIVNYKITGLDCGYYLVKEQDGITIEGYTHTSYILRLVSDVEITLKEGTVTVDKTIMDGLTPTNISDFSIGDTVVFEIEGTLPYNYHRFTDYEYIFKDEMSEGLTLNYVDHDSDPLTPEVPDLTVQFDNDGSLVAVDPSLYTVTVGTNVDNDTTIDIAFADLKVIGALPEYTVVSDTKIIVTYNATLNENAVVGGTGNLNEVYIEFDNDPYHDGKGETPEDVVYVFTFELDVDKIDGQTNDVLAGVKFKLFREHGGHKEYVVVDANGKVTGYTTNEALASELTTNAAGKFNVTGLEASVYTLTETAPLAGYDSIEDITFTVSATYDNVALQLTNLTITVDGGIPANGNIATGEVALEVVNNPGKTLPSTGGFGTVMFYTLGGLLFVCAGILLVTKRRMSVY